METIASLQDLVDYFHADDARNLNRRIHKDTACGASISVQTPDGAWFHNGTNWDVVTEISAFTIQTIIENSDATVDSEVFTLPVATLEVDRWIEYMEQEATSLWDEANNLEDEETL